MRVLVVCAVHDPRDARVYARQIGALVDAGHEVTYIAPFRAQGLTGLPGVRAIDVPRARGRHRLAPLRAVRRELRRNAPAHDVVLLHSPELIIVARDLDHPCIVWDVHEDTAASMSLKPWLPVPLRRPIARAVRWAEGWAERHWHLILAEDSYADRFRRPHPVVPNSTPVPADAPPPDGSRAVYVGHVSAARGGRELIEVGRRIRPRIEMHVIGHADGTMTPLLERAHEAGDVVWHGYLPNAEALDIVRGSAVGLSLLHDEANYRHSRPTKIMEYWAQGIPVVTTPLPLARQMVEDSSGGIVVPFADAPAAARAVLDLAADPGERRAMGARGRAWVQEHADWNRDGPRFVSVLASWAQGADIGEQGPRDTA